MAREYPSTPDESFQAANEGFYFSNMMSAARKEHRVCYLPPDEHAIKYASWDIGISDQTAIWIFELIGKEIHYIDFYQNSGESLSHYVRWVNSLRYPVAKHFMPFDAAGRDKATGKAYVDYAREAGLKVDLLKKSANELADIELTRSMLPRCFFDQSKTVAGMRAIENFRREWNEALKCFKERPLHDWSSDATKSFIYSMNAIDSMSGMSRGMTVEEWKRIRNSNM